MVSNFYVAVFLELSGLQWSETGGGAANALEFHCASPKDLYPLCAPIYVFNICMLWDKSANVTQRNHQQYFIIVLCANYSDSAKLLFHSENWHS